MEFLNILYITIIIVGITAQGVIKKMYNKVDCGGVFVFSAVSVVAAATFFLVRSGFKLTLAAEMLPYAFGFAAAYSVATVFNFLAIQCGPLSLTSLATSYSLLIPTFYGLIFDKDEAGIWLYIGLGLLAVSLFLINAKSGEMKITLKWAIFAALALVGNGLCSTVQTVQTAAFGGKYDDSFMIISLATVFVVLCLCSVFTEKEKILPSIKGGWYYMLICGIANGAVNLFVMLASEVVNKSVMFPLISAGGIVLTWVVSIFLYKEKLTLKQNIGMILGIAAIVFLNL